MSWLRYLLLIVLLGLGGEARADAIVLVHGYFSGDDAWIKSGVIVKLETAGWEYGGTLVVVPQGLDFKSSTALHAKKGYFLADLPSEAPLVMQAQKLKEIVVAINKQRGQEKIVLIGHSAGGVVARLAMVQELKLPIFGLITIAAPHLGTDKAEMVGVLSRTPLAMMAPMMGVNTLSRSRQLYDELVRERPGSFLYWLNRQPHPKARYLSLVRHDSIALFGDNTVPVWSQDMANVVALKAVATAVTTGVNHALEPQDGVELVKILGEWLTP